MAAAADSDQKFMPACELHARLLDKTLIVCMGEFGRTVRDLTVNKGRDHHRFASTTIFAGGGVKGGRIIGATDETGGKVVDPGIGRCQLFKRNEADHDLDQSEPFRLPVRCQLLKTFPA